MADVTWEDLFDVEPPISQKDDDDKLKKADKEVNGRSLEGKDRHTSNTHKKDTYEGKEHTTKKDKDDREGKERKRKSPDEHGVGNAADLRALLVDCFDTVTESLISIGLNIKSDLENVQAELKSILANEVTQDDNAMEKYWQALAGVATVVSQHPDVLCKEPYRKAVSRARCYYEHLRGQVAKRRKKLDSKKSPAHAHVQCRATANRSMKSSMIKRHYRSLNSLLDKHAKELADMKQKNRQELSVLSSSSSKSMAAAQAQQIAKIAEIDAKYKPGIGSMEGQIEWYRKRLLVKHCEFCEDEFYVDEKPHWNTKWDGVHCGECPIGECTECGAEKMKPEGTCENEHCSTGAYVYTCSQCSKLGRNICEECENDEGLHLCGQCSEFYHDDGEACCIDNLFVCTDRSVHESVSSSEIVG